MSKFEEIDMVITDAQREAFYEELRERTAFDLYDALCLIEDYISSVPLDKVARHISRAQADILDCISFNLNRVLDMYSEPYAIENIIADGGIEEFIGGCGEVMRHVTGHIEKLSAEAMARHVGKFYSERIWGAYRISLLCTTIGGFISEDAHDWIEHERIHHEWNADMVEDEIARYEE